jgi:glycosyl transferase family 25
MKILVINLKNSVERRDFQLRQADYLDISIDFIDAISKDQISDKTYKSLYNTWERPLLQTEVCCFLSHKLAWDKVIEQNQPILILEDDAIISCRIKKLLSELGDLEGIDRINLESRIKKKVVSKKSKSIGEHKMMRTIIDRSGAAGYILYPSGARKLINKYYNRAALADKIDRIGSVKSYQIEPSAIMPIDFCNHFGIKIDEPDAQVSTININGIELDYFSFLSKSIYMMRRFFAEFRIIKLRFLSLTTSQKRLIKVQKEDFLQVSNYK